MLVDVSTVVKEVDAVVEYGTIVVVGVVVVCVVVPVVVSIELDDVRLIIVSDVFRYVEQVS